MTKYPVTFKRTEETMMTGYEMQAIRKSLGLSAVEFGRALGYQGGDAAVGVIVRRFESKGRVIPPCVVRLAYMYGEYGIPSRFKYTSKF